MLEDDGSNDGTGVEGAEDGAREDDGRDDGCNVEVAEDGTQDAVVATMEQAS